MKVDFLQQASERGQVNFGWLQSAHSFSFGQWYDPRYMHFGVLRVLNDDIVAPGAGFGRHPHANFEIISIPLSGALEHRDSMGNKQVIQAGEIQVMSAGTGIEHSEMNASKNEEVRFLQIWLYPNKQNVTPRYDQKVMNAKQVTNDWVPILSPNPEGEGVWIHQDAWFFTGEFTQAIDLSYETKKQGNGLYVFVLEGEAVIGEHQLRRRDAIGITKVEKIEVNIIRPKTRILIMDIPMDLPKN